MNQMNLKQYALIGKKIEVIDSKNKSLIGIIGEVVDETKNLIILYNGKKLLKGIVDIKIIENFDDKK